MEELSVIKYHDRTKSFDEKGYLVSCTDWEEAIDLADRIEADLIVDEQSYEEYKKCAFCGNWTPRFELDQNKFCNKCVQALKSRGEYYESH